MSDLAIYFNSHLFVFVAIVTLFGLVLGSFLNVVIYRLPVILERSWRRECRILLQNDADGSAEPPQEVFNLIYPNSRCPSCLTEIAPWQNIPVISYLLLKGRCAFCDTRISARYPTVELLSGILSGLAAYHFGFNLQLIGALILIWSLLALTMIDMDHQLLPDDITLPLLWAGLIINTFSVFSPLTDALWGAVLGYVSLWSIYWFFKLLTGKEGMGYGDFKLLAALGAWFGWHMLPLIVVISSLSGSIIGALFLVFKKQGSQTPISFGPFLSIAAIITLFYGHNLLNSYLILLKP